jgi:hypothetical protein
MRRSIMTLATIAAAAALAAGFASSASAYGGGASHDTWQVGLSFNCNNPAYCGDELGGFWGWVEFDRSGGQTWGDAEFAGCGHTTGGGGPGSAGAGHISIEITSWTFGAPTPDDPNYGVPGAEEFYITGNEVTSSFQGHTETIVNDPEFLGDTGIPAEPGHYAFHPVPGIAGVVQVAFRPAK